MLQGQLKSRQNYLHAMVGWPANKNLRGFAPFPDTPSVALNDDPVIPNATARARWTSDMVSGLLGLSLPLPQVELVNFKQLPLLLCASSVVSETTAFAAPQTSTLSCCLPFFP